jgi:hypothetical protein
MKVAATSRVSSAHIFLIWMVSLRSTPPFENVKRLATDYKFSKKDFQVNLMVLHLYFTTQTSNLITRQKLENLDVSILLCLVKKIRVEV